MRRVTLAGLVMLLLFSGCQAEGQEDQAGERVRQARENASAAKEQVLRWGFGHDVSDPESILDGFVTWGWNLFDPLVKLDDELRPAPNIAHRWEVSEDGLTLTLHLRRDGRWTNGDPLTAHDYVFGWKHRLGEEPEDSAGPWAGIVGADAYAACDRKKADCEPLWDKVGVEAKDDYTLEVRFASPQPFFLSYVGGATCMCFAPLHRESVQRYGDAWREPDHLVTSGPFKVADWKPEQSLMLVKDENWRNADEVVLDRIEVTFWRREHDARRGFEAGDLDAFFDWSEETPDVEYVPSLLTEYAALSVARLPDPRQRRAMALALDRQDFGRRAYGRQARPATSLTPDEMPGFDRIETGFLEPGARLDEAKRLMSQVDDPVREVGLWINEERRAQGGPVKEAWAELGIDVDLKVVPWGKEYFQVLERGDFDAYLLGWLYDFPDAINLLMEWRCDSPNNFTGFCDREYDRLIDQAAREADETARVGLYAEAEAILTGRSGVIPVIPLVWIGLPLAVKARVEGFQFNAMGQIDLTRVRVAED